MEKWVERKKESIVIVCGDFIARTAEEGDSEGEKEERKSKDKVVREEGKEMVSWLEESGMGIGNGTESDESKGIWILLESRGCTVIDYVTRNEAGRDKINGMRMGESIKSDHLPMELSIEWEKGRKERKGKEENHTCIEAPEEQE